MVNYGHGASRGVLKLRRVFYSNGLIKPVKIGTVLRRAQEHNFNIHDDLSGGGRTWLPTIDRPFNRADLTLPSHHHKLMSLSREAGNPQLNPEPAR